MQILDFYFPDSIKNSFIQSLHKQLKEKGKLSDKQQTTLERYFAETYMQCFRLHEEFPEQKFKDYSPEEIDSIREDFVLLKKKLIDNRFKKITKRNDCIVAFESVLDGDLNDVLIDDILRPTFSYKRYY